MYVYTYTHTYIYICAFMTVSVSASLGQYASFTFPSSQVCDPCIQRDRLFHPTCFWLRYTPRLAENLVILFRNSVFGSKCRRYTPSWLRKLIFLFQKRMFRSKSRRRLIILFSFHRPCPDGVDSEFAARGSPAVDRSLPEIWFSLAFHSEPVIAFEV